MRLLEYKITSYAQGLQASFLSKNPLSKPRAALLVPYATYIFIEVVSILAFEQHSASCFVKQKLEYRFNLYIQPIKYRAFDLQSVRIWKKNTKKWKLNTKAQNAKKLR